jgi:hypothetical protein
MKKIQSFVPLLIFTGILLSCKKQKGILDDFDSGRFDFVCIWDKNGIQDTVTGEVSGPYLRSMEYFFHVKKEIGDSNSLKTFQVGSYSEMAGSWFYAQGILIDSKITYEEHDADNLEVYFQDNSTLIGFFKLTRKE